jgi:radical SAM protein with 4Fe4S-binding SPASM domain
MVVYERDDQYLVIFGDIPKWLIVDATGLDILRRKEGGQEVDQIVQAYPPDEQVDIRETFEELSSLVDQASKESAATNLTLTSKTTVAMIAVTRKCNLQSICPHCYVDAGQSDNDLSLEEHRALANQIHLHLAIDTNKIYGVNLTGGEPFARRDILEIVRAYRQVGFAVNMSTNAMLIKPKQVVSLRELGVTLSVSLDGATPKTHDVIRGQGAWKKVTRKIKMLVKAGVKVGINCLLHEGNFGELEKIIALAHRLGCSGFNPINLVQLGRACHSPLRRVPEVQVFQRLANHLVAHPEHRHLFLSSSIFSSLGAALLSGIACESCGVGNRSCIYVDADGSAYPCPNTQKEEFRLGNVRHQALGECIRFDHPVLESLRGLHVDRLNPRCGSCETRFFCGGDCRGETYNVTGDLRAPHMACQDRHDSLIELMWIAAKYPFLFEERADEYMVNLH